MSEPQGACTCWTHPATGRPSNRRWPQFCAAHHRRRSVTASDLVSGLRLLSNEGLGPYCAEVRHAGAGTVTLRYWRVGRDPRYAHVVTLPRAYLLSPACGWKP